MFASESWKLAGVLSEALMSAFASPRRVTLLCVSSVMAFTAVSAVDLGSITDIQDYRAEQMRQGRGVVIVKSDDNLSLDGRACTSLSSDSGVSWSGGSREPFATSLRTHPGSGIRVAELTADAWEIWFESPDLPTTGAAAGVELSDRLGVVAGDPVVFSVPDSGLVTTRLDIETQASRPFAGADGWLLRIIPVTEEVTECWVEFDEPISNEHLEQIAASLRSSGDVSFSPVLQVTSLSRHPVQTSPPARADSDT